MPGRSVDRGTSLETEDRSPGLDLHALRVAALHRGIERFDGESVLEPGLHAVEGAAVAYACDPAFGGAGIDDLVPVERRANREMGKCRAVVGNACLAGDR